MLPMYIIEELEKERINEAFEQIYIECPELDDSFIHPQKRQKEGESDEENRGVDIVDYSI